MISAMMILGVTLVAASVFASLFQAPQRQPIRIEIEDQHRRHK